MLNYRSIKRKTKRFCKSIMNKLNKERTLNNIFNSIITITLHNILISADIFHIPRKNEFWTNRISSMGVFISNLPKTKEKKTPLKSLWSVHWLAHVPMWLAKTGGSFHFKQTKIKRINPGEVTYLNILPSLKRVEYYKQDSSAALIAKKCSKEWFVS